MKYTNHRTARLSPPTLDHAARVTLTATDAHRLREALAEALEARELERRRYDRDSEADE